MMTVRSRIGGVLMGLSLVGAMGLLPSLAQEVKEAPASKSSRRVPPYFSKVGLSSEQREQVYAIRARHQAKIEELKRQIEQIQDKEMQECEAVLADSQRKMLEQLRSESKTKTRSRSKSAAAEAKADAKSGE